MFGLFKSTTAYENISSDAFKNIMDTRKDITIVDVRSEGEVRQGKIKGAKVINLMSPNFRSELDKLPRDKALLMYCRSGNRSSSACGLATKMGFNEVYNLKGGIMDWNYKLAR